MKKIDLQLFTAPTVIEGKKIIYLYRLLKDAATKAGLNIAYTTENSSSFSRDSDNTETKDGPVGTPGSLETTVSATAVFSKGGDGMTPTEVRNALIAGEDFEIWEVNTADAGTTTGKFNGLYMRAKCTSFELSSPAEDNAEADIEWSVYGTPQAGEVTYSASGNSAAYTFVDAVAGA